MTLSSTAVALQGPAQPKRPRRRSRASAPAKTAREASRRWGFGGSWEGGVLSAYCMSDRFVTDPETGELREAKRHSPDDCGGGPVSWHQVYVDPPAAPTTLDPDPRPRRRRTTAKLICWDCKEWLAWENRQAFRREFGDYDLTTAEIAVRVTKLDGDERREHVERYAAEAANALYWRERVELEKLAGVDLKIPPDRRYEQALLLATLRRAALDTRSEIVAAWQASHVKDSTISEVRADAA